MLYCGVCDLCGFLIIVDTATTIKIKPALAIQIYGKGNTRQRFKYKEKFSLNTVVEFKQEIATHFDTSHGSDFGCFVSHIPLKEFEQIFIFRIRDRKQILLIKEAMKNPRFWNKQRNVIIPALATANRKAKALAMVQ